MTARPRLLDLFSGAGGSARGYQLAGFHVTGVDLHPQPRYAGDEFIQADALTFPLDGFDAIHASPPCQRYSRGTVDKLRHPDLLPPMRIRLQAQSAPWAIENVPGAPMRADYRLCGCMFDLPGLRRERWFETSWHGFDLRPPCHHPDPIITVIGHGPNQHSAYRHTAKGPEWEQLKRRAMGIDWMTRNELAEAIPPAYTTFIGEQLLAQIPGAAAHVGAHPATATRSSAGASAPRGDDAAAPVSPVEAEDRTGDGRRRRSRVSASTSTTQGGNS